MDLHDEGEKKMRASPTTTEELKVQEDGGSTERLEDKGR
jgi:hypothetical protein